MDSRLVKPKASMKPLLLKDYLLDDVSSCSSNGFKSFPRRQCRTSTIRFLLEIDLKQQQQQKQQQAFWNINKTLSPSLLKLPSKSALAAFKSVVVAVKRLPFGASAASLENKTLKNSLRSLSSKILKKTRFWKRKSNRKEIQGWKSFDQLLKEDSKGSEIPGGSMSRAAVVTAPDECWSGKSYWDRNLNSPQVKDDDTGSPKNGVLPADSTSRTDTVDSANSSTKQEEKEQLSPVSVLDCPFDDDEDEEISSPFLHSLTNMEGTNKKHMMKSHQFEPVNLAKRFVLVQESNSSEFSGSSLPCSYSYIDVKCVPDINDKQHEDEQNLAEKKAQDLLNQMKDTLPSYGIKLKADKLLLHFFREKIITKNVNSRKQRGGHSFDDDLLEEAENWINGRKSEASLEWELPTNREAYIRGIEKEGKWKSLDQENKEVGLELDSEVFSDLMSELLVDISSKATVY